MIHKTQGSEPDDRFARREFLRTSGMGLAGMAVLGAAGCGGGDRGAGSGGEIVFWVPSAFREVETDAMKRIVGDFNESNPKVRVRMVRVVGDETDASKLMTAVRGGTGPDVYLLDRFTVAQRAADGVLEPLERFGAQEVEDQYLKSAWAEVLFEGRPYALPFDGGVHGGLFYRKDLLREAGIDPGEFEPENGPITVDRLRQVSSSLERTEGTRYTRLGFLPWLGSGFPYTWGFAFGGRFFSPKNCEITPTDSSIVRAFQTMYYDWAEERGPRRLQEFISNYYPPGGNPAQDPFFTGHLAMVLSGDFYLPSIARYARDLDYGIAHLPVPKQGQFAAGWSGGWSLVIPEGANNPGGAYRFMRHMCGEGGQRTYLERTQHLPTWNALLDDRDLYSKKTAFFRDLLPDSNVRPALPVGALYWDELLAAQESVTLNREEPEAALQNVEARVQQRLERYCPIES